MAPRPEVGLSRWTAGRIVALVIGALLVLVSLAPAGCRGDGPVGRPHSARGGLCHHRRPRVLHHRFGTGDRFDRARLGRGRLAVFPGPAGRGSDPGHADELRLAAVRRDRPLHRRRPLPRGREPHRHLRVLGRQDGGSRRRHARIRSRNAGLLGRLRHRHWSPDPGVGPHRRIVDRRRDERRRTTRDRRGGGPGGPHAGRALDRRRLAGRRGGLPGRRSALDRGRAPP